MTPFDTMAAQLAQHKRTPHAPPPSDGHGLTKTERIRSFLRGHGWASSHQIAEAAGIKPTLVGALLKHDLARGSVRRVADGYQWSKHWDDQTQAEALAAAALLRRLGHKVILRRSV